MGQRLLSLLLALLLTAPPTVCTCAHEAEAPHPIAPPSGEHDPDCPAHRDAGDLATAPTGVDAPPPPVATAAAFVPPALLVLLQPAEELLTSIRPGPQPFAANPILLI